MSLSRRHTTTRQLLVGLLTGLLFACGGDAQTTKEVLPAEPAIPNIDEASTAKVPVSHSVSLPENYPADVPAIGGLQPSKVEFLNQGSHRLEFVGDGDPARLRLAFGKSLAEAGWEVVISEALSNGRQQAILATKGTRSLSLKLESHGEGVRAELTVDPEAG
ncbi:MAG: hypothetical protein GY725_26415 [bacterium]|nr:hypothetical protein [bacterium]